MNGGGYRAFDGDAWLGRDIPLDGGPYRIVPESAFAVAEEMAFARQGRKARVFKLRGPDGSPYALKTFYRGFGLPQYAEITRALRGYGDIPGLRAGQRRMIDEDEARGIGEPGLTYAVLMPWIEGVSWAGVVEARFPLPAPTCRSLAAQTAAVLADVEAHGLAHADISSSNVLFTDSDHGPAVELIDVEDMYHDGFGPLPYLPDGSLGYAHPANQGQGCRNRYGDRFAGAILLAELLTWPDPAVRATTADISVFEPAELGRPGPKYDRLHHLLATYSADLAELFRLAWDSPALSGCPRLAEWAGALALADDGLLPDSPQETVTAPCPGCGRVVAGPAAEHAPTCPLRPPVAPAPVPGKSAFPGVPTYDDIAFIPLYSEES